VEGSDKPSITVRKVKALKKSQLRQVHSSHGGLHTCGVFSCLPLAFSTMKRGAEKQLSKDGDVDFEHEVRAPDLPISYFANQLPFPG
jgi:hypothetical protein